MSENKEMNLLGSTPTNTPTTTIIPTTTSTLPTIMIPATNDQCLYDHVSHEALHVYNMLFDRSVSGDLEGSMNVNLPHIFFR